MKDTISSTIQQLYGINPLLILDVEKGFLTTNKIIETSEGKFFLKQHRSDTVSKIDYIEEVENLFSSNNIPVILPVVNNLGNKHFYNCDFLFTVYPFVEGIQKTFEHLEYRDIENLAIFLANMHSVSLNSVANKFRRDTREGWDSEKSHKRLKMFLEKISAKIFLSEFDKTAVKIMRSKISFIHNNKISYNDIALLNNTIIHGDYWQENVFFDEYGHISHVFDFEKSTFSSNISELVRSVFIICFNGNFEPNNYKKAKVFFQTYSAIHPINRDDLSKAIDAYIVRLYHSTWIENEHYNNDDYKLDSLYINTDKNILYFNEYAEEIKSILISFV